jgi:hypothetical protein
MLLYKQDKGTRTVCGKKAWEGFGRAVKEDAETYGMRSPKISRKDGKWVCDYEYIGVIDARSTAGGAFRPKPSPKKLSDMLVARTNRTIELVAPDRLEDRMSGAEYNTERDVFYVSSKLNEAGRHAAIIKTYIKFYLSEKGVQDTMLESAIAYILLEQYDLNMHSRSYKGGMFKDLTEKDENGKDKFTGEQKYQFLCRVVDTSRKIMEELNCEFLTYEETAVLQAIINVDTLQKADDRIIGKEKRRELCRALVDMKKAFVGTDRELISTIDSLKTKLENASDDDIRRLMTDIKNKGFLPTYPPFEFSVRKLK